MRFPALPRRRHLFLLLVVAALAAFVIQMNRTQLWADREVYAGWRVQEHVLLGSCRLLDRGQATRAFGWGDRCSAARLAWCRLMMRCCCSAPRWGSPLASR